jgi:hypoxanthine-DNA glycosylase
MATKNETPDPKIALEVLAKYSFPPIVQSDAKILLLGTLPGEESLRLQQYYGHTRNHFWPIIAAVFNELPPASYSERVAMLLRNRIALWDVLERAERRVGFGNRKWTTKRFWRVFSPASNDPYGWL